MTENKNNPGYVQVYTGSGKGKTTAALGLALRAAGAGLKVYIAQFAKSNKSSEVAAVSRFSDMILMESFGTGKFVRGKPSGEDLNAARKGLGRIKDIFASGEYQVVILDEANIAVCLELIGLDELLDIIKTRPAGMELIITGRNAPAPVLDAADLVTEMREVKHYFSQGVQARLGIEN